jgi:beta-glucosidase/6-phospho-beta-glucosidase/beta-galactosidase
VPPSPDRFEHPPPKVRAESIDQLLNADLAPLGDVVVGVSTSSFQTEGGLDGNGEPATNWRRWQRNGRVERIGAACDLWHRYGDVVDRCTAMRLDVFRMSIEWARVAISERRYDTRAIRGYGERLAILRRAGIEPIVTLQHFTHPKWLGADFWLDEASPRVFATYARTVTEKLAEELVRRGGEPPRRILTINEPNMLALATYFANVFPHERGALAQGDVFGAARGIRMLDHLLAAHVLAHRAIHELYRERRWIRPDVSLNLCVFDVYGFGRMPFDLLRAAEKNIARHELRDHVLACRDRFYALLCADERSSRVDVARAIDRFFWQFVSPDLFSATLDAVYGTPSQPVIDSLAIDIYDPWSFQQARGADEVLTGFARGEPILSLIEKARGIRLAEPWEWVYDPDTFLRVLRAIHDPDAPRPLDVIENGMAYRREPGSNEVLRPDGVTRPDFIRGNTFAFAYARAVERLPVRTYAHWTLVDNYELGRYAPRFGLYALPDPTDAGGAGAWSDRDVNGDDAAGALAAFAGVARAARRSDGAARVALRKYLGIG